MKSPGGGCPARGGAGTVRLHPAARGPGRAPTSRHLGGPSEGPGAGHGPQGPGRMPRVRATCNRAAPRVRDGDPGPRRPPQPVSRRRGSAHLRSWPRRWACARRGPWRGSSRRLLAAPRGAVTGTHRRQAGAGALSHSFLPPPRRPRAGGERAPPGGAGPQEPRERRPSTAGRVEVAGSREAPHAMLGTDGPAAAAAATTTKQDTPEPEVDFSESTSGKTRSKTTRRGGRARRREGLRRLRGACSALWRREAGGAPQPRMSVRCRQGLWVPAGKGSPGHAGPQRPALPLMGPRAALGSPRWEAGGAQGTQRQSRRDWPPPAGPWASRPGAPGLSRGSLSPPPSCLHGGGQGSMPTRPSRPRPLPPAASSGGGHRVPKS